MLQNFSYNNTVIQRRGDGFVNLTQMCDANGKRLDNWLRLKQTQEYIAELECSLRSEESVICTEKGFYADGREQGTWGHPSLAISLARWISAGFAVWCDNHIFRLMDTGATAIADDTTSPENLKERYGLASFMLDDIFKNVPIKPELVAGLKLNAAKEIVPSMAPILEPSRQLLIVNTAQPHELLTATEIGKELGLSGQAVNKLLIQKGLQIKNEDRKSKKEPAYLPTVQGSEFADLTLATASTNSGTFQQLRWYKSVITALQ